MDWNRVEGNWKQVNGKRDQLEGKIQERYGVAKDQAQKQIDDWYSSRTW